MRVRTAFAIEGGEMRTKAFLALLSGEWNLESG